MENVKGIRYENERRKGEERGREREGGRGEGEREEPVKTNIILQQKTHVRYANLFQNFLSFFSLINNIEHNLSYKRRFIDN